MNDAWFWQLDGCYNKGVKAFYGGKVLSDCPYRGRSGVNGQRADYWRQGWTAASRGEVTVQQPGESVEDKTL